MWIDGGWAIDAPEIALFGQYADITAHGFGGQLAFASPAHRLADN